ncbi:MAG: hypothetical protein HY430_01250 [Candidatus Levybacteria bacterium]|nr:hypothetical protein [Candidatus Levybacteria bacterium]
MSIRAPRCIRIFKTRDEANEAKKILKTAGVESYITEDRFGELTLADLGMESRFRLYIDMQDIPKAARFLAKKLKQHKTSAGK